MNVWRSSYLGPSGKSYRERLPVLLIRLVTFITLSTSSGKRNVCNGLVSVRPSVCPSFSDLNIGRAAHIHRDSPGSSTPGGQRIHFRPSIRKTETLVCFLLLSVALAVL